MLHGFDEAATKKRRSEFATLHAHEANLRLMGADRVIEHLGPAHPAFRRTRLDGLARDRDGVAAQRIPAARW